MIFDIAQLIVFLATVAAYGYYLYLIGKVKGLLQACSRNRNAFGFLDGT